MWMLNWEQLRDTFTVNLNPGLLWTNVFLCLCIVQILMYILVTRLQMSWRVWYAQWRQFAAPEFLGMLTWGVWGYNSLLGFRAVFHIHTDWMYVTFFPLQSWILSCQWLLLAFAMSFVYKAPELLMCSSNPSSSFWKISRWQPYRMLSLCSWTEWTDRWTAELFLQSDRSVYNEQTCYVLYKHFITCGCKWWNSPLWYHGRKWDS